MNWSAEVVGEVPPGVVTVMSTVPADPEGEVTEQVVRELQVTIGADVVPNLAMVVDEPVTNPVPVTVTTVVPPSGPTPGDTPVTVGTAR